MRAACDIRMTDAKRNKTVKPRTARVLMSLQYIESIVRKKICSLDTLSIVLLYIAEPALSRMMLSLSDVLVQSQRLQNAVMSGSTAANMGRAVMSLSMANDGAMQTYISWADQSISACERVITVLSLSHHIVTRTVSQTST